MFYVFNNPTLFWEGIKCYLCLSVCLSVCLSLCLSVCASNSSRVYQKLQMYFTILFIVKEWGLE